MLLTVLFSIMTEAGDAVAQTPNGGNLVYGEAIVPHGCGNHFFISTSKGYSIMERLAGSPVIAREQLVGVFDTIGETQLTIEARQQTVSVFVEEVRLSQQQFNAKVLQICH